MKYSLLFTFITILFFSSCLSDKEKTIVDFNGPSPSTSVISFHQDEAIHVGIASIISPKETFSYYNDLLQYISSQLNMPIHYLQKESYAEVNELLENGAVDFAFIGSGAYIEAHKKGIVKLLVAPVIEDVSNKY
ncbi:MAG: PhnD/SsuA/transferrin family substrate-binding protein [Saprospiraceae bacterium]